MRSPLVLLCLCAAQFAFAQHALLNVQIPISDTSFANNLYEVLESGELKIWDNEYLWKSSKFSEINAQHKLGSRNIEHLLVLIEWNYSESSFITQAYAPIYTGLENDTLFWVSGGLPSLLATIKPKHLRQELLKAFEMEGDSITYRKLDLNKMDCMTHLPSTYFIHNIISSIREGSSTAYADPNFETYIPKHDCPSPPKKQEPFKIEDIMQIILAERWTDFKMINDLELKQNPYHTHFLMTKEIKGIGIPLPNQDQTIWLRFDEFKSLIDHSDSFYKNSMGFFFHYFISDMCERLKPISINNR